MAEEQTLIIRVDVSIGRSDYQSGTLSIREEVNTRKLSFTDMAGILEAFHTLLEKYKRA